jgi:hypothetical protein
MLIAATAVRNTSVRIKAFVGSNQTASSECRAQLVSLAASSHAAARLDLMIRINSRDLPHIRLSLRTVTAHSTILGGLAGTDAQTAVWAHNPLDSPSPRLVITATQHRASMPRVAHTTNDDPPLRCIGQANS